MDNKEFERLLSLAGLNRKKFAEIHDLHQNSVSNWNQKGFPGWVKPCLENYIKANAFDAMIETANKLK